MLFGEALQLALHANRALIEEGGEALKDRATLLVVRQATAIYLGSKAAGGSAAAGPSISLLAGMGDIYYNIEQLAVAGKLFINTVDPHSPILPQLPQAARDQLAAELQRLVEIGLTGR